MVSKTENVKGFSLNFSEYQVNKVKQAFASASWFKKGEAWLRLCLCGFKKFKLWLRLQLQDPVKAWTSLWIRKLGLRTFVWKGGLFG